MYVRVCAYSQLLFEGDVDMVVMPGVAGDMGILDRHAALMTSLRAGDIHITRGGSVVQTIHIPGGFAKVNPTNCDIFVMEGFSPAPLEAM